MRAISTKGDAVANVPRQTIGLPGRIGIGRAVAQVMLDLDNLSVGRLEEMHDRGAKILARDISGWKARFSPVRLQPIVAHRVSRLCACDALADGKAPISRVEGVAFD